MSDGIFSSLIGRKGAKAILRSAIRRGDVHVLLEGPPASGKSVVLTAIEEHVPGSDYADAAGYTEVELRNKLAEDHVVLCLDEMDAMKGNAPEALSTAMEQNRVTKDTAHKSFDVEISTQIFGACNDASDLPEHTRDRFRVITFPEYTYDEFVAVCGRLLPDVVEWVETAEDGERVAALVHEAIGTKSPRDARDAAKLADSAERVADIAAALEDPDADIDSEPVTAAEVMESRGDRTKASAGERGDMAEPVTESELDSIEDDWEAFKTGGRPGQAEEAEEAEEEAGGGPAPTTDDPDASPEEMMGGMGGMGNAIEVPSPDPGEVELFVNPHTAQEAEGIESDDPDQEWEIPPTNSLKSGLEIHHTEADHEAVHAALAGALDATPDNLYDSSEESEIEGFDLRYTIDIGRESHGDPFDARRFHVADLMDTLEETTTDGVLLISEGKM